jgi:hypothetical protein
VVNHLQNYDGNAHVPVGFVYFHYKRQKDETQKIPGVLATVLRQLFETRPEVADVVGQLYERHEKRKSRPTDQEVRDALCASVAKCQGAFIIVDALDEYLEDYSQEGIQTLLAALLSIGNSVRLMVTSRILAGMERVFEDFGAKRLEILATDGDIRDYLWCRIAVEPALRARLKTDLAQLLVERVTEAAQERCVRFL